LSNIAFSAFCLFKASVNSLDTVNVEGRKFTQIDFILPGQLAFALLSNALFGMAFGFISLKKELVLKRLFAAPIAKWTIMGSQVLSKAILAILQTLVIVLGGTSMFKFTLVNGFETLLQLIVMSLIGIFTFMAFGLCVAVFAKNEDSASPIANLIMMPQLFLAGAFFSIDSFPASVQTVARILPMTLLNDSFKKIAFEGLSLSSVGNEILGILIWGVIIYLIIIRFFKWE
jgi:ABC-2 type transport system permease protein